MSGFNSALEENIDNPWKAYMGVIYQGRKPPAPLGTVTFDEIEAQAKEKLKDVPGAFMYAGGSAGTNSTYRANQRAFDKWAIIPRMLRNVTNRTLETTLFGKKLTSPLLLAPIGVQNIFCADGEIAAAKAAKKLGIPMVLSTAASRTIEEVAEANEDGHRWFQLYWPRTNEVTISVLNRAKEAGYTALVVTLDTTIIGWRPHDLDRSYLPFVHGIGVQVGASDPVFMARYNKQPITQTDIPFPYDSDKLDAAFAAGDSKVQEAVFVGIEWMKEANSGIFRTWEDLNFLRENWEGPLLVKGIQCLEDAEKALQFGVDGIVVSNHGGRQVDGAIPSLYALEHIMKSEKIRAAQRCGVLTLGIEQVIRHTLADLDTNLVLSGYKDLSEIQGKGEEILMRLDL
ncbi:oxidoreductase [Ephemerocybe angulata]|uniref:Oxidoreductase n=1 Tax=Ephemerocybe angulata TaxID=980116 RepID=A0A8H6HZD2_9AGAR|nr:oxidoreductase [Tulosesus angulatus]